MVDERQRRSTPVRWPRLSGRRRRQLLGLAGLATVAVIIAGVIAAYNQVFTPGVPATVIANEAGLLMKPGASVTLYGKDVGHVTSVTSAGSDARLGISIDPGEIPNIPADVQASIQAPTLFGPKYLSLVVPHQPPAQSATQSTALSAKPRLRAGQVIEPTAEPTEIGTVFESLVQVLSSVDPAKLSATLGAMSTALSGNGGQVGSFVSQLDSYLREFNPSLPALSSDLTQAPGVLRTFARAAPDLVATLGNLRPASRTLVSEQAQFDAFLLDLTGFSDRTSGFLRENGGALAGTLRTLAPVTGMLAYYSPEFPCLFASANEENGLGDPTLRIRMSAPRFTRQDFDEPVSRVDFTIAFEGEPGSIDEVDSGVEAINAGLGLAVTRSHGMIDNRTASCVTPVDEETSDVRFSVWIRRQPGRSDEESAKLAAKHARGVIEQFEADIAIWQHQRYTDPAALVRDEYPGFTALRAWARQFYPGSES